jgi:hypothetical protein
MPLTHDFAPRRFDEEGTVSYGFRLFSILFGNLCGA